jgi:hypothetical protein
MAALIIHKHKKYFRCVEFKSQILLGHKQNLLIESLAWLMIKMVGSGLGLLLIANSAYAQLPESVSTGYQMDPAEEYWILPSDTSATFLHRLKHLPVFKGKGVISMGGSIREGYDYFNNYLWGRGPQDVNGYLLHRVLFHTELRLNKHFRVFGELGSSLISGRNGGARPVQDLNMLAGNQLFAEYSQKFSSIRVSFRAGNQVLHYGFGSLLDIRDANVHRSFSGFKLILDRGKERLDFFYMQLIKPGPGSFDDKRDPGERIIGGWYTRTYDLVIKKIDIYILLTHRQNVSFVQATGLEDRQTIGANVTLATNGWSGAAEADYQLGRFNYAPINAWKFTLSVNRQLSGAWKPVLSLNGAVSSGDKYPDKPSLQTFSPVYPKGIYYGFIDIAGSANIILLHPKLAVEPFGKVKITGGYYIFWRESVNDGLYAPNGGLFLTAENNRRHTGNMIDLITAYTASPHFSIQAITTYYARGAYLKLMAGNPHNTFYYGLSALVKF